MAQAASADFKTGDRLLMVGTMKGVFLFRGRGSGWSRVGDPRFPGQPAYALAYDDRSGKPRLFAGSENPHFGAVLRPERRPRAHAGPTRPSPTSSSRPTPASR